MSEIGQTIKSKVVAKSNANWYNRSNNAPLLVIGTGGNGKSLSRGCYPSRTLQVRMLGTWKEGIQAVNNNGLRLIDERRKEFTYQVEATDNAIPAEREPICHRPGEILSNRGSSRKIGRLLNAGGVALTLQNGLDNHKALAQVLREGIELLLVSRRLGHQ